MQHHAAPPCASETTPRAAVMMDPSEPSRFGQLAQLYRSNQFLMNELQVLQRRLLGVREYRLEAAHNPILAQAHEERLRARRSAVLVVLRANRITARVLLKEDGQDSNAA